MLFTSGSIQKAVFVEFVNSLSSRRTHVSPAQLD